MISAVRQAECRRYANIRTDSLEGSLSLSNTFNEYTNYGLSVESILIPHLPQGALAMKFGHMIYLIEMPTSILV